MKQIFIFLLILNSILQAQTRIPLTIIDDHVENYESTTFKICFDNNADMKSLDYIPFLSSAERPDLQSVLEEFYLSPKFESKAAFGNQCILSTSMQVNSKFENQQSNLEDCQKFKTGTFIYGKNNLVGTIVRRTDAQQTELSDSGMLVSDIEWLDDCNYVMKNPIFESEKYKCPNCEIKSKIVNINGDSILLFSQLATENHYLEMIKVNSLNFDKDKSWLKWQGFKNIPQKQGHLGTMQIADAILVVENDEIKYLNAVLDINSLQNLDIEDKETATKLENHLKSEDFFETEKFPYADFRLLSAKKNNDKYALEGILTIKGNAQKINFTAKLIEEKDSVILKSDEIILKRQDFRIDFEHAASEIIQNEMIVEFELFFRK